MLRMLVLSIVPLIMAVLAGGVSSEAMSGSAQAATSPAEPPE